MYCLDTLLYTLAHIPKDSIIATLDSQPSQTTSSKTQSSSKDSLFFARSDSVSVVSFAEEDVKKSNEQFFGGGSGSGGGTALHEAFPFAKQPHLLQPHTQREFLFGGANMSDRLDKRKDKVSLPVTYPEETFE